MGGWDAGLGEDSLHAIPVQLFAKHVMDLHMNQEVGFAKEYEEIRAASCLEEFAAQESQNPDNVDRNRYPNIVACKWKSSQLTFVKISQSQRRIYYANQTARPL